MISITLIIVGISILIIGFILLTSLQKLSASKRHEQEMERLMGMAAADGVFTPNEKKLITKFSKEIGLNHKAILKSINERIENLNSKPETEFIDYNKKTGDDFEDFIVQKFNKKFFTITE
ncbi:MAG: hypothetical protein JRJ44_00715 [Deltaproteobacteria bacterium]|nr:hypothetical protein [Deltaproteobacteria bacterium]